MGGCGRVPRGQAGLLLWYAVGGAVEAGGIDRDRARTRVEKTLCRDPRLLTADLEDEGGKKNEDRCRFYEYVGTEGARTRPIAPPNRKWLDFCN